MRKAETKNRSLVFLLELLLFLSMTAGSCSPPGDAPGPAGEEAAFAASPPLTVLYGFNRENGWFRGKSEEEILSLLHSWNVNAVFGVHQDRKLAEVLRKGGIRIFAEFTVFAGEKYWDEFPGSRPVTAGGEFLAKRDWYAGVNPADERIRSRKLQDFRELLETYDLDGVWLDFIRWPCHWEEIDPVLEKTSYDRVTLEKFRKEMGIEAGFPEDSIKAAQLIDNRYREEWREWRCGQITSWVTEARGIIDTCSPGTRLGLFGVPWIRDFDDAIISVIGQDYRALGASVDVFSPMVYHLMCGRPVGWIGEVTEWIGRATGREVLPIIQTVDEPSVLTPAELAEAVRVSLDCPGSAGVILFNLQGLDEGKLEAVREVFGATGHPEKEETAR